MPEAVSEAELEATLKNPAEEYVKEIAQSCHEYGVRIETLTERGGPVEEIVKEAQHMSIS